MNEPKVKISGLYKSFGTKSILKGVDLDIMPGEIMYVIGKSGAGKSVLLKHIVGLMLPDSGKIFIDNDDINTLSGEKLFKVKRKIGLLFQMSALFDSINVFENVAFTLKRFTNKTNEEIKDIVAEKLRLVGLQNIESKIPSELSGGMQKRVALARAIAVQPEIMLYDEPTTGVDPISAAAVDEMIILLNKELGVTSLVISHDIASTFRVAHNISMLYEGNFILKGSPDVFKNTDNPIVSQFIKGDAQGSVFI